MKFALNSALDSLPTNKNLHLWGKKKDSSCPLCKDEHQSLQHVLNGCPKAQELRRYCERHDNVLEIIHVAKYIKQNLTEETAFTVDLPGCKYTFPQHIVPCQQHSDIVWQDDMKKTLELTISYESSVDTAHQLKTNKYVHRPH